MIVNINVQTFVRFEPLKEELPFGAEPRGEITPKTFNPNIVNTSAILFSKTF